MKDQVKLARAVSMVDRFNTVVEHMQSWHPIAVRAGDFDSDSMMLGVTNGVLNLATAELERLRLDLRVAKCAPVSFVPTMRCPRFIKYLERFQPDKQVRRSCSASQAPAAGERHSVNCTACTPETPCLSNRVDENLDVLATRRDSFAVASGDSRSCSLPA